MHVGGSFSFFSFFLQNKSMITALTARMNQIISKPINLWQNGWVDRNENGGQGRVRTEVQGRGQAAVCRTRGPHGRDLTFWEALLTKNMAGVWWGSQRHRHQANTNAPENPVSGCSIWGNVGWLRSLAWSLYLQYGQGLGKNSEK